MTTVSMGTLGVADMVLPHHEKNDLSEDLSPVSSSPATTAIHHHHDGRDVSFPEILHWATLRRADEDADTGVTHTKGLAQVFKAVNKMKEKGHGHDVVVTEATIVGTDDDLIGLSDRQRELATARRALRQAGWATVFYLVTCDILGPFSAPYAIGAIGMVPGILLYILFGAVAGIGGWMLCRLFLRLDSVRYPIKTYGDLADRVFGRYARHFCSILQSVQLIINVGLICLSNGQSLSQITKGHLCFSVCVVIWALCGMFLGQIRGLQNFSILANASVWLNLLIIFLSMGFVAHSPPNFAAAFNAYGISEGPVIVKAVVSQPVFAQVNGVFNMVFAYGGAMIFPEILAEMKRPRDFVRGMAMAQCLIFSCYLLYGIFVYAYQGQFVLAQAYQGVSKYAWQTIGNVMALITGLIAAGLYGNIGLKVFYIHIIEDIFNGPPLMSRKGNWLWSFCVLVYWALAFIVGSAIPSLGPLSGLVAAMCIFQFTYTFPPLLMLGLDLQIDAAAGDEEFTTPGVVPRRVDTWRQWSRWHRAIFGGGRKRLMYKIINFWFFMAALATAALGLWATGTDLRESIAAGAATSFGCTAPV